MAIKKIMSALLGRFSSMRMPGKSWSNSNEKSKTYAFAREYRSVSENGEYAAAILHSLKDQKSFDNFKRMPEYQNILEHVTKQQGQDYLNIIRNRKDGIFNEALKTVLISDSTGNPVKYSYDNVFIPLSPTTLRYVKVASDLDRLFGRGLSKVAEIGCGYGGQCLVNDALLEYKHAVLFDLPFVNELIERYLNYSLMNGAYKVKTINQELPHSYDLVISNYAFSELPAQLQLTYIRKVMVNSKRGYLTMNSGIGGALNKGKLCLEELRNLLPSFDCLKEEPLTYEHNYIIVWGHDKSSIDGYFLYK